MARQAGGQLNSKMRLVTAPWLGAAGDDVVAEECPSCQRHGAAAGGAHRQLEGVRLMAPVESNGVFAETRPRCAGAAARQGLALLSVGPAGCRLMCAWDTAPETVDRFAADLKNAPA